MQWQRKLYDQEDIPPPHCWDEIKANIAHEPMQLGNALYDMESIPPAQAWDNIRTAIIQQAEPERAIDLPRIPRRSVLSYAAALVGFGVLTAVLLYMVNNKEKDLDVRNLAAGLGYADSQQSKPAPVLSPAPNEASAASQSLQASENPGAKQDNLVAQTTPDNPVEASVLTGNQLEKNLRNRQPKGITVRASSSRPQVRYADGNYIQLVKSSGDTTLVSYKLQEMVQAVHSPAKTLSKEASDRWINTLDNWKEKMARSSYIPSGTNFFDIAEMVACLNTEQ